VPTDPAGGLADVCNETVNAADPAPAVGVY